MTNEMTPADIRACTGGYDNGWGGDNWLPWFFLSAMGGGGWGGWGGGNMAVWLPWLLMGGIGAGGWGNNQPYATAADVQRGFDNSAVITKLNGLENGLCDGFYTTTVNTNNGFAGVQSTLAQGFGGINTELVREGYEDRIAINGVGQRVGDCCCEIRQQMAANDYNCNNRYANLSRQLAESGADLGRAVERGFCETQYRDQANTNAIMQNAHSDTDRIIARIDAMETNHLREMLDNERAEKLALRGALDRAQLRSEIVNDLNPCARPAYVVQPPQPVTFRTDCCGGTSYAAQACGY